MKHLYWKNAFESFEIFLVCMFKMWKKILKRMLYYQFFLHDTNLSIIENHVGWIICSCLKQILVTESRRKINTRQKISKNKHTTRESSFTPTGIPSNIDSGFPAFQRSVDATACYEMIWEVNKKWMFGEKYLIHLN